MIRTGLRTSRPKPMEMLNGRRVCDIFLTMREKGCRMPCAPLNVSNAVQPLVTRIACVS